MSTRVVEAVILMAGLGSRFRAVGENRLKPTLPFLGRPLISHTFDTLAAAGITKIYAVSGFEADSLRSAIEPLVLAAIKLSWIHNPEWQKQNGITVLAAAPHVSGAFLLTMGDHLFQRSIVDLLLREAKPNELSLAIDPKLDAIFDLDDAMKVKTVGDRVVAIGKDLVDYDAIDTGLFICPPRFFHFLEEAKTQSGGDDCSLVDGVRLMAATGAVRGIDIGSAWWQDIDTPEMLVEAQTKLAASIKS